MAISIAMLLLVVSIPIFSHATSQKNSVASEAGLVSSFIVRAQNYAYHPDSPEATAYKVDVSKGDSGVLELKRLIKSTNVGGSDNMDDPQNNPIDSLNLTSSTVSPSAAKIIFSAQSGKAQNVANLILQVVSKKDNTIKDIVTISPNGSVNVTQ